MVLQAYTEARLIRLGYRLADARKLTQDELVRHLVAHEVLGEVEQQELREAQAMQSAMQQLGGV